MVGRHKPGDYSLRRATVPVALFVALLWLLHLLQWLSGWDFTGFGVYPGALTGLVGLVAAPLVHGSWSHLFSNTLPLLVLGISLLYGYPRSWKRVLLVLYPGSGLLVWLFARPVFHVGASGLSHGLMFYIFVSGILRRDRRSIALSLMVFFLYGGMIWSIFPNDPEISFEYHLAGAVLGVALAFWLRGWEQPVAVPRYSWETDATEQDDVIGDQWRDPEQKQED